MLLHAHEKQRLGRDDDPWLDMNVNVSTVKAVAKVVAATVTVFHKKIKVTGSTNAS